MSYTPGPWKWEESETEGQEWNICCGPEPRLEYQRWEGLATVYGSDDLPIAGRKVGEANARLIAQAPSMADLLRKLIRDEGLPTSRWLFDLIQEAETILREIDGESK